MLRSLRLLCNPNCAKRAHASAIGTIVIAVAKPRKGPLVSYIIINILLTSHLLAPNHASLIQNAQGNFSFKIQDATESKLGLQYLDVVFLIYSMHLHFS